MIAGLVAHDGSWRLARHLSNKADNKKVSKPICDFTVAQTLPEAIRELKRMTIGSRIAQPLLHAWASPQMPYSEKAWALYWRRFETEFRLEGLPYVEVTHKKYGLGRAVDHKHRVYLRIDLEGRTIPLNWSGLRIEKLSRIAEHENGEPFVPSPNYHSVVRHLRLEGRQDVADAMVRAKLDHHIAGPAPKAAERAAAERVSDFAPDEVWHRAIQAWTLSKDGPGLRAALEKLDLKLAMGDDVPVVVTPGGSRISLRRAVSNGAKRAGLSSVRKRDIDERLKEMDLVPCRTVERCVDFDAGAAGHVGRERRARRSEGVRVRMRANQPTVRRLSQTPPLAPITPQKGVVPSTMAPQLSPVQKQELRVLIDAKNQVLKAQRIDRERADLAQTSARRAAPEALRASEKPDDGSLTSALSIVAHGDFDRDAFKADLAGLSRYLGGRLRWVQRDRPGYRRLCLYSGTTIMISPDQVIASTPAADAIPLMIDHALQSDWPSVTIASYDPSWREAAARAAIRAGLTVVDDELIAVIHDELEKMQSEQAASEITEPLSFWD